MKHGDTKEYQEDMVLAVPSIGSYLMKLDDVLHKSYASSTCSTLNRVVPNETSNTIRLIAGNASTCSTLKRVVPNETRSITARFQQSAIFQYPQAGRT